MPETRTPLNPGKLMVTAIVAGVAAALTAVIVLRLIGVEGNAAIVAGVVGAVVGSVVSTMARR